MKEQTFENKDVLSGEAVKGRLDGMDAGTEAPEPKRKRKGKRDPKRRRAVLYTVLGVLAVLIVVLGVCAHRILKRPETMFTGSQANVTEAPRKERVEAAFDLSAYETPAPAEEKASAAPTEEQPTATETPAPTAAPRAMDHIVNVLLMGIDAYEDGDTTSGTQPHTDVIMVLAINFDKDTVDMISIPRDMFTTAPGYYGIYKLNGVFNVGGGMDDLKGGFDLCRQAAEIWLGGITIDYYYALDFQAVIDIVDAIGGIDYDLDIPISYYYAFKKRAYSPGWQHLDGNAVMGYLRVRHGVTGSLDSERTARQRRMLMAIYDKLRTEGKLSQIPALVNAASSGIYTNTTLSQTAALANYAMKTIGPDNIRSRSLEGEMWYQHYWKYCFVDQQKRIDLIREVYGIEAEPIGLCTPQYENWLYDIGYKAMKYVRQPEKVFKIIQEQKDAGKTFTDEQIAAYAACYQAYTALDEGFAACSERVQKAYLDTSMTKEQTRALEAEVKKELSGLNQAVKDTTLALARACKIHTSLTWVVDERWFADPDINEKRVYFG